MEMGWAKVGTVIRLISHWEGGARARVTKLSPVCLASAKLHLRVLCQGEK